MTHTRSTVRQPAGWRSKESVRHRLQSRLTPETDGTVLRIPLLYQRAIGYIPEGDSEYDEALPATRTEILTWAVIALGLTVLGFACLELKSPMFFTHDDNYLGIGTATMYTCRALFSGVFPVWNPFQGGGEPIAESVVATTYLPLYMTYGISRFLLGNEFLFVESTMCFNLLLTVVGSFWAGRKWGLSPALACAFGLSFTFCGFLIVTSRSWVCFSAMSAWIPLIFGCCAPAFVRKASWKWALGTGIVMGCAFHAGFSQLWVYAILFESIIIMSLFICGAISFRNISWNIPAVLIAVAIAMPMAWVQMDFAKDSLRNFSASEYHMRGIPLKGLLAILVPPPGISITHPIFCPYDAPAEGYRDSHAFGVYYYSGAILSWGCVFLLASLAVVFWPKRMFARNILILLAVFVLLICLGSGSPIPVNKWMSSLPWFEKFRQPWRYFIFFVFFSSLGGALFYERISRRLQHGKLIQGGVAIAVIALLGATLAFHIPTWMQRPSSVYPALSPGLNSVVKDPAARFPQRVVSWASQKELTNYFQASDYPEALVGWMPSVYEVLSLDRYNTLTWFHTLSRPIFDRFNSDPLGAWRAYGVRWVICHPKVRPVNPELFHTWPVPPIKVGNITLLELRNSAPLAFAKGQEKEPLPITFSAKGATVQFPSPTPADEQVVVNVLGWPRFRTYADRKPVSWTPDEWGRVVTSVPAKTQRLEVVYEPPWGKGIGLGMLLAVVALGISCVLSWFY